MQHSTFARSHLPGQISNPKPLDPPSEDSWNIIRSFLQQFDTTNLPSVEDAALEDLCLKEGERRGYDLDVLKPALTVGLNIASAAYHHLSNDKVKVFIVFYTAFVTYFDDAYPDDPDALVGVPNFTKHFAASEKQSTKMLNDLANLLAETSQLFGQVSADFIVHAGLKFIAVLVLETQNKYESMHRVDRYALYLREMSGLGEAYAMFIFPAELQYNTYVQALPLLRDFIDFTNDITSFYKEECEGETHNLVSFLAEARGEPKSKALYYLVEKCMEAHERILLILSPHKEAQGMYKEFVKGFLSFHLGGKRYRLGELNL
ncbi:terpenoid synthase [Armillaria solidipes]|uniref:Terpenoid synthase n=1 Tax=Armillaria solidipes TaxID=1076256 RepID=A0A2H3BHV1_9AGAR|nr:terpenoid synthase [Armillaria solidipes]